MFDVLWYRPQTKGRVLSLLRIPSAQERAARGVIGVRWGPGQPKPPSGTETPFNGPGSEWCMIWGNFRGYEKDPDTFRALCDLKEIEPGLIGGTLKPGALETKRFEEIRAEDEHRETELLKKSAAAAAATVEPDAQIMGRFLDTVGLVMGIRNVETLEIDQLEHVHLLAIADNRIGLNAADRWLALHRPKVQPQRPILIEEMEDFEAPLQAAMAAVRGPTIITKRE